MTSPPQLSPEQLSDPRQLRARIPRNAVYRRLAAETVMLNIDTGMYFGLNQTAGRMLEVLEQAPNLYDALHALVAEFDIPEAQLAPDLLALCNELGAKGLIIFELIPTDAA